MRICRDCIHAGVCDPNIQRKVGDHCAHYSNVIYTDIDSVKVSIPEAEEIPACTILWNGGETTYIKGKNALRIARHWLYDNNDCLMIYTPGWIYLKPALDNPI